MAVYFGFVLGIGFALKKQIRTSEDFFLSGRSIPSWITGLAFMSANLGAIEVMGMAGNGAKYGIMTAHFYWVGAVPAMLFLAIFMMPFYYGSRIKSVPEYLKLRFNEPTRAFNAISFAIMTILMSGINMYAMALVFHLLLNWNMDASICISAVVVLAYTALGGLTSSIYNEVLQFFLIVLGLLPLTFLALTDVGGWSGLVARLPGDFSHLWANTATAANPMGADWICILSGLGFVLSFGYWCTDFLAIQRALAAESLPAAQRTPVIAALPEIFFPALTVLPGMCALALIPNLGDMTDPKLRYDMALPLLMAKYYPSGMLGIGLTAMLASFMAGMAGNITAFNTVFTYDIYKNYFRKTQTDEHYIAVGRLATGGGIFVSIFTAYTVMRAESIMDYMQSIFSFFNAPLFATFLLGMFWKRTTPWGAFFGLLSGTLSAATHFVLTEKHLLNYVSPMAANFWQATIAWCVCFVVTVLLSFFTKARPEVELDGLVWGTAKPVLQDITLAWYKKPALIASAIMLITLILDLLFW
ncbi:MAG: sodium:solute symporter family protein [Candidatus Obscuribacterales bacterium]|jgi:SSS family solute:Na+ symporter|nr:sodium:solute symporter family protein [Candidatus Obscuribacterales bacterium]